jgi:hypothetical protein
VLKDKDLEFANSIPPFFETMACSHNTTRSDRIAGGGRQKMDNLAGKK